MPGKTSIAILAFVIAIMALLAVFIMPGETVVISGGKKCTTYDFDTFNDQNDTTWLNLSNMSDDTIVRCLP